MSSLPLNSAHTLLLRAPLRQVLSASTQDLDYGDGPPDPFKDAQKIGRIAQCPLCLSPLHSPVTLQCGNSLCMRCIPKPHVRQNITYPATPNRLHGFICPFSSCKMDHAIGDCNKDVTLNKIMNVVRLELDSAEDLQTGKLDICLKVQERDSRRRSGVSSQNLENPSEIHPSGRRLATHTRYEIDGLLYDSELDYQKLPLDGEKSDRINNQILLRLKEAMRSELDCQVCYGIFMDPYVTACGHTFCHKCLERVLEHSKLCPICRSPQTRTIGQRAAIAPSKLLSKILDGLYPETASSRTISAKHEEVCGEDINVPLFICTLSFPGMPTFLHIFEPRYRLMIRRVMETSEKKFGMLLHNPCRETQGNLGPVGFYEYGTLLQIINLHRLPNDHILIETIGLSRFRVVKYSVRDEYTIGKIEPIGDISIPAEEALEACEILSRESMSSDIQIIQGEPNASFTPMNLSSQLSVCRPESISTRALLEFCVDFVNRMQEKSAAWLQRRVFQAYGNCPQDPDLFPWWFASVLPISDKQKYELLSSESVRDRLKICARWVNEIEIRENDNWDSNCGVF